jgi:heme/copper-type cytochrome/quinol oxidase subunit 2
VPLPEDNRLRAIGFVAPAFAGLGPYVLGETNLEETMPLVWTMLAISVAGALITFGVLTYALWKFRDPAAKRRRHG